MKSSARSRLSSIHSFDPRCHWCGTATVLPDRSYAGRALDDNTATVDHIYSRLTRERAAGRNDWVLACNVCNAWRCQVEHLLLSEHTREEGELLIEASPSWPWFIRPPFPDGVPNISPKALKRHIGKIERDARMSLPIAHRVKDVLRKAGIA